MHHLVFSKLSSFTFMYEQSRFCEAHEPEHGFLQQEHWYHSKQAIQRISYEQLAFPKDVAEIICRHLTTGSSGHRKKDSSSFLPQSVHAFKGVECEITPSGIIRTVMVAFTVVHKELSQLLHDDDTSSPSPPASTVLSADVLIPSLVLMVSRLSQSSELDLLWRRC